MSFALFIVEGMDGGSDYYEEYVTYEDAETIGEKCVAMGKAESYYILEVKEN